MHIEREGEWIDLSADGTFIIRHLKSLTANALYQEIANYMPSKEIIRVKEI